MRLGTGIVIGACILAASAATFPALLQSGDLVLSDTGYLAAAAFVDDSPQARRQDAAIDRDQQAQLMFGMETEPVAGEVAAKWRAVEADIDREQHAGVIIVSLVAASLGLPFLLKGLELPPEPSQQEGEDRARIAAAEAAIQAIERAQHQMGEGRSDADLYTDAGVHIMELYRQRIDGRSTSEQEASLARKIDEIERRLRLTGLRAERAEIYRIARVGLLSDETSRKLVRELDLLESRFTTR